MPIDFSISTALEISYVRCHGIVTVGEFKKAYGAYRAHPLYRPGRPEMLDVTGAEDISLSFRQASALLTMANRQRSDEVVETTVVMLAGDRWSFAAARMFETLSQNTPGVVVTACMDESEALTVAGIDVATVTQLLAEGEFGPFLRFDASDTENRHTG
jgi:hypothetical protein